MPARTAPVCLTIAALLLAGCVGRVAESPAPAGCPSWADFPLDRRSNQETAFLGCSNLLNLQDSVNDPRDLILGRRLDPRPAIRDADAVRSYETNSTKPSPRRPLTTTGPGSTILEGLR